MVGTIMNFINVDPHFTLLDGLEPGVEFYYKGCFDTSIRSIVDTLYRGGFPINLKGNFSFFYKDQSRVVLAVDHAPTTNLYYTDSDVSHVFSKLRTPNQTVNASVSMQLKFYGGSSFGIESPFNEIKRLNPGTYVEKNLTTQEIKIETYVNLFYHETDKQVNFNTIGEIVEEIVEQHTRDPFNLLYSSGTDSNCLLGFIRKLKRTEQCNLISLYSNDVVYDEKDQIEAILKKYKLKTNFYKIGKYVGKSKEAVARYNSASESLLYKENFNRIFCDGWSESTVWQKFEAIYDTGNYDRLTLTGEVGDELFNSGMTLRFLRYAAQVPEIDPRAAAIVFLSIHVFRQYQTIAKEHDQWLTNINSSPERLAAWNNAVEYFISIWNKTNQDDITTAARIMVYYLVTAQRITPYTQFSQVNFFHPFEDYRLFWNIWKLPNNLIFSNKGTTRLINYSIIKDYVVTLPWEYKKIGTTSFIAEENLNRFRKQQ